MNQIVITVLTIFCIYLYKKIKKLDSKYNTICNILNDENHNAKAIEGNCENLQKIENFPLTLKQLELLRKHVRKKITIFNPFWTTYDANKWLLPVIFRHRDKNIVYYRDKNGIWVILNSNHKELSKCDCLNSYEEWKVILDCSQIKELLHKTDL